MMEDNHKPEPNSVDKQHNTTTTDDNETTQHQPSPYHPENLSTRDRQEPPKVDDNASAETANDLPIINRRRPSEAETKLVREYGGKENLREKTKLAYNELDIDPGAETPQEEKSFAEGVVGEMDVEAQERKFHLGGYIENRRGVKKGGSGKS